MFALIEETDEREKTILPKWDAVGTIPCEWRTEEEKTNSHVKDVEIIESAKTVRTKQVETSLTKAVQPAEAWTRKAVTEAVQAEAAGMEAEKGIEIPAEAEDGKLQQTEVIPPETAWMESRWSDFMRTTAGKDAKQNWLAGIDRETLPESTPRQEKQIPSVPAGNANLDGMTAIYAGLSGKGASGNPVAPMAAQKQSAVGNLAEHLLEESAVERTMLGGRSETAMKLPQQEWNARIKQIRREDAAESLYHSVNAVWLRGSSAEERRVVVQVNEGNHGGGVSLREFDRAFQRDARRYDGGLSLT